MIASHYVEPSRNEEGGIEDANWCTAYQKDRDYWDDHNEIEAFIYICGESIPSKKVAISISEEYCDASGSDFLYFTGNLNFNIWDFDDYNDTIEEEELLEVVPNLHNLIEKAYKKWDRLNSSLGPKYNPETDRYDYDGSLFSWRLKKYVNPNGDGFTINFGKVTGTFDCSELDLISLKGAPQTVGEWFSCNNNRLASLKGAPQKVDEGFDCSENRLTSLEGAPKKVGGNFYCSWNRLPSLKGAPTEIGGFFSCCHNPYLHSLEGLGKVKGEIIKDF